MNFPESVRHFLETPIAGCPIFTLTKPKPAPQEFFSHQAETPSEIIIPIEDIIKMHFRYGHFPLSSKMTELIGPFFQALTKIEVQIEVNQSIPPHLLAKSEGSDEWANQKYWIPFLFVDELSRLPSQNPAMQTLFHLVNGRDMDMQVPTAPDLRILEEYLFNTIPIVYEMEEISPESLGITKHPAIEKQVIWSFNKYKNDLEVLALGILDPDIALNHTTPLLSIKSGVFNNGSPYLTVEFMVDTRGDLPNIRAISPVRTLFKIDIVPKDGQSVLGMYNTISWDTEGTARLVTTSEGKPALYLSQKSAQALSELGNVSQKKFEAIKNHPYGPMEVVMTAARMVHKATEAEPNLLNSINSDSLVDPNTAVLFQQEFRSLAAQADNTGKTVFQEQIENLQLEGKRIEDDIADARTLLIAAFLQNPGAAWRIFTLLELDRLFPAFNYKNEEDRKVKIGRVNRLLHQPAQIDEEIWRNFCKIPDNLKASLPTDILSELKYYIAFHFRTHPASQVFHYYTRNGRNKILEQFRSGLSRLRFALDYIYFDKEKIPQLNKRYNLQVISDVLTLY